jgi:predicted DCC family thiol-disulfide oxidoreductase YuxK
VAAAVPEAETSGDTPSAGTDTLFYDGRCPLCAAEIAQLAEARGGGLALRDIHALSDEELQGDKSRDALLRTLHLRRADGRWLSGADANVAAWEGTAQEKRLRLLRAPLIRPLVDLVYRVWAWWRYRRLYGAQYRETPRASDTR